MADDASPLRQIVLDALREMPRRDRRLTAGLLVTWGALAALQIWDVSGREGPEVAAELLGALVLLAGALILALAWTLQRHAERQALALGVDATSRSVVQALPVLASAGAACFGFAAAMLVTRALLGAPLWFVALVGAGAAGAIGVALHVVARSVRGLYRWAQDQASRAVRAEADGSRAQLYALQAQMQPHFLFNALNTVASLIPTEPDRAERTVEHLAGALRRTLRRTGPLASLDDEIQFVRDYLAVERERLGDRLDVVFDVPPGVSPIAMPRMSLQPMVENALKYAVGERLSGARITVTASREDDRVRVSVADDGEGFAPGWREGTGLGNLRRRLATLYGDGARLDVASSPAGATVTLEIPATPVESHAADRR
jgi:signal transduction histidine kinase